VKRSIPNAATRRGGERRREHNSKGQPKSGDERRRVSNVTKRSRTRTPRKPL
jgi:hypothetical protein